MHVAPLTTLHVRPECWVDNWLLAGVGVDGEEVAVRPEPCLHATQQRINSATGGVRMGWDAIVRPAPGCPVARGPCASALQNPEGLANWRLSNHGTSTHPSLASIHSLLAASGQLCRCIVHQHIVPQRGRLHGALLHQRRLTGAQKVAACCYRIPFQC